jgi:hypothetical protein
MQEMVRKDVFSCLTKTPLLIKFSPNSLDDDFAVTSRYPCTTVAGRDSFLNETVFPIENIMI